MEGGDETANYYLNGYCSSCSSDDDDGETTDIYIEVEGGTGTQDDDEYSGQPQTLS